ncbi:MAG TPA: hypothetical protein VHN12_13530 [Geobacteraceae bacterium]|nr:hypothetical protein [Geobacteraceae bacterium]
MTDPFFRQLSPVQGIRAFLTTMLAPIPGSGVNLCFINSNIHYCPDGTL